MNINYDLDDDLFSIAGVFSLCYSPFTSFCSTFALLWFSPVKEHIWIRWLLNFQTNQPVFVRLLQGAFRVSHCQWLTGPQRYHVENCIKTLSESGTWVRLSLTCLSLTCLSPSVYLAFCFCSVCLCLLTCPACLSLSVHNFDLPLHSEFVTKIVLVSPEKCATAEVTCL